MVRRSRNFRPRSVKIGIFCEGETEQKYFKMLQRKYHRSDVKSHSLDIKSERKSGVKLLKIANTRAKQHKYDRVYVVFDRDDKTTEDLKKCQQLSKDYGITMLVSSECFEFWLLLHYEFSTGSYTRKALYKKLSGKEYFGCNYVETKGDDLSDKIEDRIHIAEKNGNQLLVTNNNLISSQPFTNISNYLREIFGLTANDSL
ncbi:RloB family protein [Limosilactobacillus ingluviei]